MRYYHISNNKNLTRLIPKIPESASNRENRTIKRVCCANTISNCLSALQGGVPTECYVYEVLSNNIPYILTIDDVNLVEDGFANCEVWFTEPVLVKCLGKITYRYKDYYNIHFITPQFCTDQITKSIYEWKWIEQYT